MAGLEPDTVGIWHPSTVVCRIDMGNEVLAASALRIESIGEAVESDDRHSFLPVMSAWRGCQQRNQPLAHHRPHGYRMRRSS
jgi:hypothetical protein